MKKITFYTGVFLVCGSVMALQILQSRLFSVVTWYSLSFLVISITMFGLTLGALSIYRENEEEQRRNLFPLLNQSCFFFAISIICSLVVQLVLPIVHSNILGTLVTLPLMAGITATSYFYAGRIVTLCLTRSAYPVGKVYAADLTGASIGCLGALLLMNTINLPSAILIVAVAGMIAGTVFLSLSTSKPERAKSNIRFNAAIAIGLAVISLANAALSKPFIYPLWTKGALLPESSLAYEHWNAISRVTVSQAPDRVFLWGASPTLPPNTLAEHQYLMIDGDAGTPLTKFDGKSWDTLKYLQYDVTNIAYFMPGLSSGAIIGVGGGRDLLSARYFGLKRTVAMDVNSTQVNLLTKNQFYRNYTNLAIQPNTDIINSEARSWLTRSKESFDIIQMSLIDTWASTGAGAFALSENSLYTVDAFKIFLSRLNPHGALTVSRWYTETGFNELARLTAVAVDALQQRGETDASKHIFIAQSARIATLVVDRDPFTNAQLKALSDNASRLQYKVLAAPNVTPENPVLKNILNAHDLPQLLQATAGKVWNLTPSTDMKPFFFNQAYVGHPLAVIHEALSSEEAQSLNGNFKATLNLYAIIVLSLIMGLVLLVPPLKTVCHSYRASFLVAGSAYFAMIGVGFMFIEISLMQTMSMFLGHPTYGLGIVLFSLILSSGLGSYISEYVHLNTPIRLAAWCVILFGYVAALSFNLEYLMTTFIKEDFIVRAILCTGLIFPCGLMLGFGFPTGLRLASHISTAIGPWFWAINGAAGVTASAVAILLGISLGLDKTLFVGGLMYLLLALPLLKLYRGAGLERSPA